MENVGSGAFGTVVKALWSRIENTQEIVAIKKIEGGVSDEERIIFLKEAVIMGQFNHPNIVKILGIVADSTEVSQERSAYNNILVLIIVICRINTKS